MIGEEGSVVLDDLGFLGQGLPDVLGQHVHALVRDAVVVSVLARDPFPDHVIHVLRGHLQLAAYVVFAQFLEKLAVSVRKKVVEPDSGADKDFLDPGQGPDLPQEFDVFPVIHGQVLAEVVADAFLVRADAFGPAFGARRGVCASASKHTGTSNATSASSTVLERVSLACRNKIARD